ncbi:gamma-glutamyltransferase family protein [Reyranella sp. CPCC 100927]|uniref:gamma-glutamyltransferase family protein n=1 Tax=Reyranella sp. CPCC 100927 TaxID=2599616 RepID=UPI0015B3DC87|nr:gamma-glutamyltransferase family protein [Reyranella sp. CPCC 100927]
MNVGLAERPEAAMARRAVARGGMVATAHPLASRVGLDVLARGGNAMDAAIAAVAVLGVVQPMMSGLGGDSFILIRSGRTGAIRSVNASGPAPHGQSLEWARKAGLARLPDRGMLSVSVPGAVAAMCAAHQQFGSGRHSLAALLQPAIGHATDGVALTRSVARFFALNEAVLAGSESARAAYLKNGKAPAEGEVLSQPELANTLEAVAAGGADAFYRGEFARRLVAHSAATGGLFSLDDLAEYQCETVEPLSLALGQGRIYTNPPVGQGIVLLEALGILERCTPMDRSSEVVQVHRMIEALKLAFLDRNRHLGDPRFVANPIDRLLSDSHLRGHAGRIDDRRAMTSVEESWSSFGEGDTTCLATADESGNVVAYISSLSTPFGAAEVIDGTGVLMNNRAGRGFTLDPTAPNCLAGGKRTMSTLHVYMVCDDDGLKLAGGTSGGDGQPQWNLQILDAVLNGGRDLREAIDQPRWELMPGTDPVNLGQPFEIRMDGRFASSLAGLGELGHRISDKPLGMLGAAQAIAVSGDGTLVGAADPRADGCALGLD